MRVRCPSACRDACAKMSEVSRGACDGHSMSRLGGKELSWIKQVYTSYKNKLWYIYGCENRYLKGGWLCVVKVLGGVKNTVYGMNVHNVVIRTFQPITSFVLIVERQPLRTVEAQP